MGNRVGKAGVGLCGLLSGLLLAGMVQAQDTGGRSQQDREGETVYRCQTENDVVYQDFPCEGEGEQIDLPTALPEAEEVKKLRRRQAEMRMQLEAMERERQREAAAEARRTPEVVIIQSVDEDESNRDDDQDRTSTCPLGLANCKKPDARVFRRPAENRETPSPLGLSDDADGTANSSGEAGGTLAEPR